MKSWPVYKRNTWVFYITQLLHSLIFIIPIWIVYYQGKITGAEISYLVTIQYLAQMFLELPSGALADLIGRKNTNLMGWLIGSLSYFLFPLATTFTHFVILALMVGLNDSFRSGSEEALLYDTYKQAEREDDYNHAYATGGVIYQVGLIIGTALGGFLFEQWVFLPYLLYAVSLALGVVCIWFYVEPKIDSEVFSLKNYYFQITNGSKEAFKSTYATYLSLYYICVAGITWAGALYFNGAMMVELVASDTLRGMIDAGMRLANVIVIRMVLQDERLFGAKSRILFFPIVMMIAYLPGIWLVGFWGTPFIQFAMMASTARWFLLSPLTNRVFSSKYRATAISFLSLVIGFVYVALTATSGPIITLFGIQTMYTILGVITLITVVPLTYVLLKVEVASSSAD
ncbi:MAG: MFS transporter [Microgenomates group bacterium]